MWPTKRRRRKRREQEGEWIQSSRDGKQFQHSDWALIKGSVTILLDFPLTTQCTLLPIDDKIITNSSTQHFSCSHFHALIYTCIEKKQKKQGPVFYFLWADLIWLKISQTDKNKQNKKATVMNCVLSRFPFRVRRACKWLNICEHAIPAVTVTSEAAVWSWHHWHRACACVRVSMWMCVRSRSWRTRTHVLSAHCSQTACHRPWARRILQLWCHHCETEHTGWGIFCLCFCLLALSLAKTLSPAHTLADVTPPWHHRRPERCGYFVITPHEHQSLES